MAICLQFGGCPLQPNPPNYSSGWPYCLPKQNGRPLQLKAEQLGAPVRARARGAQAWQAMGWHCYQQGNRPSRRR